MTSDKIRAAEEHLLLAKEQLLDLKEQEAVLSRRLGPDYKGVKK